MSHYLTNCPTDLLHRQPAGGIFSFSWVSFFLDNYSLSQIHKKKTNKQNHQSGQLSRKMDRQSCFLVLWGINKQPHAPTALCLVPDAMRSSSWWTVLSNVGTLGKQWCMQHEASILLFHINASDTDLFKGHLREWTAQGLHRIRRFLQLVL